MKKSFTSPKNEDWKKRLTVVRAKDESASTSNLNNLLDIQLKDEEKETKIKNSTTTLQDLQKINKIIKYSKNPESDVEVSQFKNSPKSLHKYCDNLVDDDVYAITAEDNTLPNSSVQITSIKGFFNRKRGRPPKNRFVEVYKNDHQKPQAIFTSFKLEKHGTADESLLHHHISTNSSVERNVQTSKSGESYNKNTTVYPIHKPLPSNSTLRKNCIRKNYDVNESFKTPKISNGEDDDNNFTFNINYDTNMSTNTYGRNDDNDKSNLNAYETMMSPKKEELCESTVIRAAGTFFPKNVSERTSNCGNEKLLDLYKEEKRSSSTFVNEDLKLLTTYKKDDDVAQNLGLKDKPKSSDKLLESKGASLIASPPVLPQIYNVLQMQQQLLAFYQQMALSHVNQRTFPTSSAVHTATTDSTTASIQTASIQTASIQTASLLGAEPDLLPNKDLSHVIINPEEHQVMPKNSGDIMVKEEISDSEKPLRKRKLKPYTETTTSDNSCVQNKTSLHHIPIQVLPEKRVDCNSECSPSGYSKFRYNENCGSENCVYRMHQSHFHCTRSDCQYSFCDKTRFAQHTTRHKRLDTLVGTDFKQYPAAMPCDYYDCPYLFNMVEKSNNTPRKLSHFHCLKCPFVCADSTKVVAHRRLHKKMEYIRSAGFRKFESNQNCMISSANNESNECQQIANIDITLSSSTANQTSSEQTFKPITDCPFAMRYSHYHCLTCNCSVLYRSHLVSHKHRNSEMQGTSQPSDNGLLSPKNLPNT